MQPTYAQSISAAHDLRRGRQRNEATSGDVDFEVGQQICKSL